MFTINTNGISDSKDKSVNNISNSWKFPHSKMKVVTVSKNC